MVAQTVGDGAVVVRERLHLQSPGAQISDTSMDEDHWIALTLLQVMEFYAIDKERFCLKWCGHAIASLSGISEKANWVSFFFFITYKFIYARDVLIHKINGCVVPIVLQFA